MINLEQNTQEWLDFRKDKIGASYAGIIMGCDPWTTPLQLWERMVGLRPPQQESKAMTIGKQLEPVARELANEILKTTFQPNVFVHPDYEWLIASLDGFSQETQSILEIKCAGKRSFDLSMRGIIPEHYNYQMQHQMFVSDIRQCWYLCCHVEDGEIINHILQINTYDEKIGNEIFEKEKEFYENFLNFIPPKSCDRDYTYRTDREWEILSNRWKDIKHQITCLEQQEEALRNTLISMSGNSNSKGNGVSVSRICRKGNVNYKSIPELSGVDLESYRCKPTEMWRITQE